MPVSRPAVRYTVDSDAVDPPHVMLGSRKYTGPERRKAARWRPRPLRLLLTLLVLRRDRLHERGYLADDPGDPPRVPGGRNARAGASLRSPSNRLTCRGRTGSGNSRGVCRPARVTMRRGCCSCTATRRRSPRTSTSRTIGVLKSVGVNILAPGIQRIFRPGRHANRRDARGGCARRVRLSSRSASTYPRSRIVIYGWSLGSAVAVRLASEVEEAAVVLEGAPGLNRRYRPACNIRSSPSGW